MLTGGIVGLVITDIGLALLSAGVKARRNPTPAAALCPPPPRPSSRATPPLQTIFVCCAEDPGVLYLRDPELARLLKLSDAPPPEGLARP